MERDRFLEVAIAHHVEDGGERLATHKLGLGGHADDRGLYVIGIRQARDLTPAAAHDQLASVGLCFFERRGHLLVRPLVDERTDQRPRGVRVADLQAGEHVAQPGDQLVDDVLVCDHPAQGRAALAGGSRSGEDDSPPGELKIGRGCHDRGIVPAKLQQRSPHAGRHARGDLDPHALRSGRAHERNIGAVHQHLAISSAGDHEPMHRFGRAALRSRAIQQGRARHRGERSH